MNSEFAPIEFFYSRSLEEMKNHIYLETIPLDLIYYYLYLIINVESPVVSYFSMYCLYNISFRS